MQVWKRKKHVLYSTLTASVSVYFNPAYYVCDAIIQWVMTMWAVGPNFLWHRTRGVVTYALTFYNMHSLASSAGFLVHTGMLKHS
jgi:hypothetical protein